MEETYKCPLCDVVKPLRGLACHAGKVHKLSSEDLHVAVVHGGVRPLCKCGCGEPANWLQRKFGDFKRGHNGFNDEARKKAVEVRTERCARGEISSWNVGLSRDADERVARMADKTSKTLMKRYETEEPWQTKDPEKKSAAAAKASTTWAAKVANEYVHPLKGRTKHDHAGLAIAASKISITRLANHSSCPQRFTSEHVREFVTATGVFNVVEPFSYQNKYTRFDVRCRKCGEISSKNYIMLKHSPECYVCNPRGSLAQREIYDFVRSLAPDAMYEATDVIAPKELDVYVPSKKFAVEHDGLYWHSSAFLPNDYHETKRIACEQAGVSCFRVFEDEWRDKRPLVEAMIRHKLGLVERRVGARECELRELELDDRRRFFEANHIDGDVRASAAWGLFAGDDLVAALSIRTPFHASRKSRHEVARFATRAGTSVQGALGKLTKAALAMAKRDSKLGLSSYVDGRLGDGRSYAAAGYHLVGRTVPRFWWTDFQRRIDRFAVRADKANGITQAQAAEKAGVVELWGCSNAIYEIDC